jgi:hypothetical protein
MIFAREITLPWLGFCTENLADLTVEFARHELVSNLIPKVAATIETVVEDEDGNVTDQPSSEGHEHVEESDSNVRQRTIRDCLLQGSHEVRISISTTWRWERGWVDEGQLQKYTMAPATDDDGNVLDGAEEWSLRVLMASCLDFAEEMTALQHVGNELGVAVIISPKFHAELAGEGIEYSWGISKALYRRKKPLNSKRSKESFKRLVLECTSRQQVLRTATVRKLSRRARSYICAYYALYESNKGDIKRQALVTLPLIERVVNAFKTHRAVIDFDAAFVNGFAPLLDKEFFS